MVINEIKAKNKWWKKKFIIIDVVYYNWCWYQWLENLFNHFILPYVKSLWHIQLNQYGKKFVFIPLNNNVVFVLDIGGSHGHSLVVLNNGICECNHNLTL